MLPEGNKSRIAEFIEHHVSRSAFSYSEISIICGFNTNTVLYGWMSGDFKLPLNKVTKLAGALNVDAGQLFVLAMEDWFSPGLFAEMREHFMSLPTVGMEVAWVDVLRKIFDGNVPPMTDEIRGTLERALASVERRPSKKFE